MKLIECKNQAQIIKALLFRKQNSKKSITENDIVSIFFLIEDLDNVEGMIRITCSDENIIVEDIYTSNESIKFKAFEELEKYGKKMNFKYFMCLCEIESSYFYRDAGFSNFEDLCVEGEKLFVKMVKKI